MKKKFLIPLIILSFFTVDATIGYYKKDKKEMVIENTELRGIYISYLEFLNHFYGGSSIMNQKKIDKMIDNIKEMHFNLIILHVSPFSDSIYKSKIFPYSYTLTGIENKNPGFDYLDYFLKAAHKENLILYAWINPYRISFNNIDELSDSNPAKKLVNTTHIKIDSKGIYYNPASEIVKDLIISQVREILDNYDVDGIHFDDYFYVQNNIDNIEYQNYLKNGGQLELREFRLNHTNDLIRRVYKTIKDKDNNITFSIAPDGNINNNYLYHYADVKTWMSNSGYVDIIMPQIYYGFFNEYEPFLDNINKWMNLWQNKDIKMMPVLAFYKSGFLDEGAGGGQNEWQENNDVLKKQIIVLRNNHLLGYSLFRYDYLYGDNYLNDVSVKEKENLKKLNENYG